MRARIPVLVMAIGVFSPSVIAGESLVPSFALSVAAASMAEERCDNMRADILGQAQTWVRLEDDGADAAELRKELRIKKAVVEMAFAKVGRVEWCRAAWELFGPDGLRTIKRPSG